MDVRKKILNIVKKEPKTTIEIIEKLKRTIKNDFIQENESKFYQTYLKGLEEKGILFKISATKENKKMLKDIFHRKVWKRKKKKSGDFPKGFKTYYIYAEYPNSKILREAVNKFIKNIGEDLKYKEELKKETNRLIKLLSEFTFLANKKLKLTSKQKDRIYNDMSGSARKKKGDEKKPKEQKRIEIYINLENIKSSSEKLKTEEDELEEEFIDEYDKLIDMDKIISSDSTINHERINELKNEIFNSEWMSFITREGNMAIRNFLRTLKEIKS